MDYIRSILKHLWASTQDSFIYKVLVGAWVYFIGIHMYIYAILSLTFIDVVMGVLAARKKGEAITSRKLRKGLLEKTALYMVLLVSVFILDKLTASLIGSGHYFSFIITFLICSYELTSITENISIINPNIPFLSGLVKVFKKMGESTVIKLEEKVDDITKDLTDPTKNGQNKPSKDSTSSPEAESGS